MKAAYLTVASFLLLLILLMNFRLHHKQEFSLSLPEKDVLLQLEYLSGILRDGAGENMQAMYPEGYVFTFAMYGLAWTEVARYGGITEGKRVSAIAEAEWALASIESEQGHSRFVEAIGIPIRTPSRKWYGFGRPASPGDMDAEESTHVGSVTLIAPLRLTSPKIR